MAIHAALHHRTRYRYDRLVSVGPQIIRLRPAPHSRTRILSYSLQVRPEDHFLNWQQDPQSNYLARVVIPEKTRELSVEVDLVAEMSVFNPFDFFLEPVAERFPFKYDPLLEHELAPFQLRSPLTPHFSDYLASIPTKEQRTIDFLVEVNQNVWRDVKYVIRMEPGVQTPEETLSRANGSCRDSAWLLCQLFRHCGLASRFVSGYLIQLAADVKALDGPSGPETDFTDLHAWCEVYLPGAGWIGLDSTSGLLAGEGHIPLAAAPDPTSAAPITGVVDECKSEFDFEMRVTRILESPRVTKPYTEEQWESIEALGHQLDEDLKTHDVRLTMGGEPTFVSIDDFEGDEWNTLALGPLKRNLADDLLRRLQRRFAPGALLHFGQGKWYPGESLPRWAFGCYWRKDGTPIWEKPELVAEQRTNYGHTTDHAAKFMRALAARLEVDSQWIQPGFEDVWYYLWKERRLPTNVDPHNSKLRDEEERARLARIFEQGLASAIGYALPIQRVISSQASAWASGPWFLRPERLYLIPGDSPMGFRLPLDSLPWAGRMDLPYTGELDPTIKRGPLGPRPGKDPQRFIAAGIPPGGPGVDFPGYGPGGQALPSPRRLEPSEDVLERRPKRGESAGWIVRTALCVEPRQGKLHVFLPPVSTLDEYLELVAGIEDTAEHLQTPVIIEGYTPPFDPRLNVLKITPDPGVIEVNLHPSASWNELVERTTVLYSEAREARLGTEKFMLDGRHTGTGGGNHIVIGGPTPADSPLLRRPDLLRSLVSYWQNHPSLSFLFNGLFLGPTSQSPRVDEARNDSLYELEIAFKQIPQKGSVPPWLTDRLFRNLLVDATGNTHRAEFSIDKLYTPDSAAGRLGLLEMRALEMPPHSRMSLTQHLLLRALISRFWQEPYTRPLVRWGTEIHDRWMLPHFVWQDFEDVLSGLQNFGYMLKPEWFAPHFEFRFPFAGDYEAQGIRLEIRHAL